MPIYQDLKNNEVRMLRIIDPLGSTNTDLVHCVLEHVSLDEFTPDFSEFLEITGRSCNSEALRDWVHFREPENVAIDPAVTRHISLPHWRMRMQKNDMGVSSFEWEDTMKAMGVDTSQYSFAEPVSYFSADTEQSKKERCFSFLPRFRWGDFEAISYCWESEIRDKSIVLNGTVFAVPRNLEALLQRMQRLRGTRSTMKLWIDAFCINQKDVGEKNHQVKLMKSIYTNSFAVIVWLGEAADESDKAIDFMAAITRYTLGQRRSWGKGGYDRRFQDVRQEWAQIFYSKLQTPEMPWKALLSFLSRQYWQRLWIIQELALNHNMTMFLWRATVLSRHDSANL